MKFQVFEMMRIIPEDRFGKIDVVFRPITKDGIEAATSGDALQRAGTRFPRYGRRLAVEEFHDSDKRSAQARCAYLARPVYQ